MLLEVEGLSVAFGATQAVDGLSFGIAAGEALAIVGESGSGKTAAALAVTRLLPSTARVGGTVRFDGRDLTGVADETMRRLRGDRIGMVFQEPMTSLNPVLTIAEQIGEAVAAHRPSVPPGRVMELLRLVGIPDPQRVARGYPHQLSGGMRQRVMIAIAVACDPALVIADEPTTALDVTIQAQILALFARLRHRLGTALLLISHDLGVVAQLADRVVVVYAGQKMEEAPVARLFASPRHPYTRALLAATFDLLAEGPVRRRLLELPDPGEIPPGCPFASRCPHVFGRCRVERPPLYPGGAAGHTAACFLLDA